MTTSNSPLLCVSDKEKATVRSTLNLGDEDSIRRDVDMVLEWYSKQQHLPRVPLDRGVVERMLVSRKGSVEQTKQKMDTLYTLRTLMPEMYSPRDVLHPNIQQVFKACTYAALPRLNHDLTRVQLFRLTKSADSFVLADTFKYAFMVIEYRLKHDYALGDRFIYDLENASLSHLARLNPVAIVKAEAALSGYGSRIAGVHYINAPPFVGTILKVLESAMSDKLYGRVAVHSSLDELHQVVSKEILPQEYGGQEKSLEELGLLWKEELSREENRQYLLQQERLKSDEALRLEPRPSDDMLGIPGSFKKIDVD